MSEKTSEIIKLANETFQLEANAILDLATKLNDDFIYSVNEILKCKGKVVVTGVGKSAIIAEKIAATFNSTGTPSIFMHAADAAHGDLGIVQKDDVVIAISKSGNTEELKVIVPYFKKTQNKIIAIVGNVNSYLGHYADFVLNTSVEKEACPNNLAPTTSTLAQLAMGDALAVCLVKKRNFSPSDFAKYHPGGMLGKSLLLSSGTIAEKNAAPQVNLNTHIIDVIKEIGSKRMGATAVTEGNNVLGIITDGDIRRMLENKNDIKNVYAKDIMSLNPKIVEYDVNAQDAFVLMRQHKIGQLIVTRNNLFYGMIHLQDLLNEGFVD